VRIARFLCPCRGKLPHATLVHGLRCASPVATTPRPVGAIRQRRIVGRISLIQSQDGPTPAAAEAHRLVRAVEMDAREMAMAYSRPHAGVPALDGAGDDARVKVHRCQQQNGRFLPTNYLRG